MALLFKSWLFEAVNVPQMTQQYKKMYPKATDQDIQKVIDLVTAADPTPNKKYTEWIFREFINNRMRLPEDAPIVKQQLDFFTKSRAALKRMGKPVDITTYTRPQLWELLQELEQSGDTDSNRQKEIKLKAHGAKKIYDDGNWTIIEMTTPDVCSYYARGTKWCTSDPETAAQYLAEGPLYIFYKQNKPYAQLHIQSEQFMDPIDRPKHTETLPEDLKDIVQKTFANLVPEDKKKLYKLFGIKEKVIVYPDGGYWGTHDFQTYYLTLPGKGDVLKARLNDGILTGIFHGEAYDTETLLLKHKNFKDVEGNFIPLKTWSNYVVDFLENKNIVKEIAFPNLRNWTFADLDQAQRDKIFKDRPEFNPETVLTCSDGNIWIAPSPGDTSYELMTPSYYPVLKMFTAYDKEHHYINYGSWLSAGMLKSEKHDHKDFSLATTEFILKQNIEFVSDNGIGYNSWKFSELNPEHQKVILANHPHFDDMVSVHEKHADNTEDFVKRLNGLKHSYFDYYDNTYVVIDRYKELKQRDLITSRSGLSAYAGTKVADQIVSSIKEKILGHYGENHVFNIEDHIAKEPFETVHAKFPFITKKVYDIAHSGDKWIISTALEHGIAKPVVTAAMKLIYNHLKLYEDDTYKFAYQGGDSTHQFGYQQGKILPLTPIEKLKKAYREDKSFAKVEEEFKSFLMKIRQSNLDDLVYQINNIPRTVDEEEFAKAVKSKASRFIHPD